MKKRPDIGTKMYSVHEHLYYIPDYPAPVLEYVVLEAKVTGFYTLGYTEVCLVGKDPDGHNTPYRYPLNKIGKSLYYSKREAAVQAEQATKRYEHAWGWLGAPDIPMRRPWEPLLLAAGDVVPEVLP